MNNKGEFLIDSKKDGFIWKIEKEKGEILLRGEVIKNLYKNAKQK